MTREALEPCPLEELLERLTSHMVKQDVPILIADCRLAAGAISALQAEIDALRARLGVVPGFPDGIECREAKIAVQGMRIENLRARVAVLEGLIKRYVADFEGDFCFEGAIVDEPDAMLKCHYFIFRTALKQEPIP